MLGRVIHTLIFCGFFPRHCAIGARNLSLPAAYLGHCLALLVWIPAYVATVIAADPMGRATAELRSADTWTQPVTYLILFFSIVGVELAFALLGLLLLPWTDPPAPLRTATRHALRTAWLHTGHLCLAGFPFAVVVIRLSLMPFSSESTFVQQYILPAVFGSGVIWYLWAVFRAATAPLEEIEPREPLCEGCGYNLSHHQDPDDRCPECGQSAQWSLSPNRRQPLCWRTSRRGGRKLRWLPLTINAWTKPEKVFPDLSTQNGPGAAGLFLAVQLFLTGEAFAVSCTIGAIVFIGRVPNSDLPEFFYMLSLLGGLICLWIGAFICLVAAILGLIVARQTGRNCLGGVIHVACYCSGIFPAWAFLQTFGTMATVKTMNSLGVRWRVIDTAMNLGIPGLIFFLVVLYIGGVARRSALTRYANR